MKEFNVPVTSNSVSAGGFELKVNIKKVSVKTKATSLEFECSYKGQGIAVVDPSKIQ